jgi:SHS2 domain-containing protein
VSGSYEILEHTADTGLRATGRTLAQAFEAAGRGMFAVMGVKGEIEPKGEMRFDVEADSLDRLFFRFLSEILFIHQTKHLVFSDFRIELDEEKNRLVVDVKGEEYSEEKHGHLMEIKAITWHMMEVRRSPPRVQVIFDI